MVGDVVEDAMLFINFSHAPPTCLQACKGNVQLDRLPWLMYPSCPHTTLASGVPQRSSQTVPQALLLQSSTRPS